MKHLTIRNYALIRHLEMEPSRHLNVITGETGAGKSIMLGAMGLLMGNRADTRVLGDEGEKCIIEGEFDVRNYKLKPLFAAEDLDYDDVATFRREISPGGKSRAFINDTPVTLDVLRRISGVLMDIHSQHETLLLGNQGFQRQLIDAYAANETVRDVYHTAWLNFVTARKNFDALNEQAETLRQESDFVRFQLDELANANLEEGEQQKLESDLKVMEHAEEIKARFNNLLQTLRDSEVSARQSLTDARTQLQGIATYAETYEALFKRMESVRLELEDIVLEIEKEERDIEFDAERAEWIKERLSTIYHLLQKHRVREVGELLELQAALQQKADLTSNLDEALAQASRAFDTATKELELRAAALSESRKKSFDPLRKQLTRLLKDLGIPDATIDVETERIEPSPTGADRIEILFSANKGISPRPLAQVASGGEFSRLMFGIKYIMAEKTAMPTLVLDEIDSGVSGEIAIKLGDLMKTMSASHQLITITHLPQIAAKGDAHYFVFKDNSEKKAISNIRLLSNHERVEEIAKMIGGEKPSKVAIENAQELMTK